jgi:hypothetical protein
MKLRVINEQHNTTSTITLAYGVSHITVRTAKQLRSLLCGVEGCDCFKKLRAVTLDHGQEVRIERLRDGGLLFHLPLDERRAEKRID